MGTHSAPTRLDQILQQSARLFAERGYAATSVRDIGAAVDLQGQSLYSHVGAKEDLLWQVVERASGELLKLGTQAARGPHTASERLGRLVKAHVSFVARDLAAAACYLSEWRYLMDPRRSEIRRRRDEYEALFRAVIEEGVSSGEFTPTDPKFASLFLLGSLNWVPQWFRTGGPLGPDEVADRMTDLILRGVQRAH